MRRLSLISLLCLLPALAFAASSVAELRSRAASSLKLDPSYEKKAGDSLFADGKLINTCAPRNEPPPAPFSIFVEILADGGLGETAYAPETKTAKCMKPLIAGHRFPKPPANYVVEINLKFEH